MPERETVPQGPGPEAMRQAVAGYVQEIHRAYADQAATFAPGVRGRMPLMTAGPITVAAVAARNLHLLATTQSLGALRGPEVALDASYGGIERQRRFYHPGRPPRPGPPPAGPAPALRRG